MPLSLVERRRAREFAQALETGRTRDRDLAPLLEATAALAEAGRNIPPVHPEFRAALRQGLLDYGEQLAAERAAAGLAGSSRGVSRRAGAATHPGGTRRPVPSRPPTLTPVRRRAAAFGVALGVIAGGMATTAMAAQAALPGDRLYGVKRTVEDVRLKLAGSDTARGQQHLAMANNRLGEVSQMLEEFGPRPSDPKVVERIEHTFGDMAASTEAGRELLVDAFEHTRNPAPLARLMEFSRSQGQQIRGIAPLLPYEVQPSPGAMLELLNEIATEVTNLSPPSVALPQSADLLPLGDGESGPTSGPTGPAGSSGGGGSGLPIFGAPQTVLDGGIGGENPGDPSVGVGVEAGEGDGPLPTANASVGVRLPGLPLPNVGVNLLGIGVNLGD
ncbi:MAG: DUF5667 domain-containing protein [Sporichthyaceae bacterium]|nr:DUF5667 domain-containing protein [Sporichthyaceae bacterium]